MLAEKWKAFILRYHLPQKRNFHIKSKQKLALFTFTYFKVNLIASFLLLLNKTWKCRKMTNGKLLSTSPLLLLWSYALSHLDCIYCTTGKLYLLTNKSKISIFLLCLQLFPCAEQNILFTSNRFLKVSLQFDNRIYLLI